MCNFHRAELLQDEEEFDENAVAAVGDEDEEKDKDKDKEKDKDKDTEKEKDKDKSLNKISAKTGTTPGPRTPYDMKFQNITAIFY